MSLLIMIIYDEKMC